MDTLEAAAKLYGEAGATYVRGIDRQNVLWEPLDFPGIPDGIFVDEQGIVRYVKLGGFDVRKSSDKAEIERLLAKPPRAAGAQE